MTPQQFWHEDVLLFRAYEKAYYNHINYNAWLNGKYNFIAVQYGCHNALASKKSEIVDYVDYVSPFAKEEEKVTKEELEENHRNLMIEQNLMLKNLLKGKNGG